MSENPAITAEEAAEQRRLVVDALHRERAAYESRGDKAGASEVDAELARFGAPVARSEAPRETAARRRTRQA